MTSSRLTVAALVVAACSAPTTPPPTPPEAVSRVLSEAIQARTAMEALAQNAQTWGQSISKQGRIYDADRVHERVPSALDEKLLRSQLDAAVAPIGLKIRRFELAALPPAPRALPATTSADAQFRLDDADVLAEVPVTLELAPPDPEKARALRDALRQGGPLWKWDRLKLGPSSLTVAARVFVFRDVTPPRYLIAGVDLDADLAKAGAPRFGELSSGPHRALAAELQGEYVRRAAARADAEPGLANLAKLQLLDARYRAFKRIAAAVEAESFSELLE